jgi:CheY-like chemotaxis protein
MPADLVLVVEDDAATRLVLTHSLLACGFRILVAQDGREGIALYTEYAAEVCAIVTDCLMPEVNGLQLASAIRTRFNSQVPIIMVTNLEYSLSPETLCEHGINYIVGKPFSPKAVCKLFRDVVDDRHEMAAAG